MKIYELISIVTYGITKLIPKKRNLWVFGSWFGNNQSDNSKAFSDYINQTHPEIEIVWVVNYKTNYSLGYGKPVQRNSINSLKYLCRAQVAVMNQGFGDLAAFNFLGGCYGVQLWHGVAWKKIAKDSFKKLSKVDTKVFKILNSYNLYISPSKTYSKVLSSAFDTTEDKILECGQPRNERLFNEDFLNEAHERLLKECGEKDKKIIVYMPTFRDTNSDNFTFLDYTKNSQLRSLIYNNAYIIIEKLHFKAYEKRGCKNISKSDFVFEFPNEDAQTLLAAADILITDYSSCFFDYLIRNKPIINFVYDYEFYKDKDRGLYYSLNEVAPGEIAADLPDLVHSIENCINYPDLYSSRRDQIRNKFITYESDKNSETIAHRIFGDLYGK